MTHDDWGFTTIFPKTLAISRSLTRVGILRDGWPDVFLKCVYKCLQLDNRFAGGAVEEGGEDAISEPVAAFDDFGHRAQHFVDSVYSHRVQFRRDDDPIRSHQR